MPKIKIDNADKYFSQWVRLRDGECKRCGSKVKFNDKGLPISHEVSHFMGRRKENTRFMAENCDTLCTGCHFYFTAHPAEHYDWQVKTKGQETVDKIRLASNMYCKKDRKGQALLWKQELTKLQSLDKV